MQIKIVFNLVFFFKIDSLSSNEINYIIWPFVNKAFVVYLKM